MLKIKCLLSLTIILLLSSINGIFRRDAFKIFDKFTYPELVLLNFTHITYNIYLIILTHSIFIY